MERHEELLKIIDDFSKRLDAQNKRSTRQIRYMMLFLVVMYLIIGLAFVWLK